jgi:hypothetical protein
MATVASDPPPDEKNTDNQANVIKTLIKTSGASAGGITSILAASAFGAIPSLLAILAVVVFGVIMIVALVMAGRFITAGGMRG